MGFVIAVIWKVVKSGRVCAGTRILLSLDRSQLPQFLFRKHNKDVNF